MVQNKKTPAPKSNSNKFEAEGGHLRMIIGGLLVVIIIGMVFLWLSPAGGVFPYLLVSLCTTLALLAGFVAGSGIDRRK